MFLYSWPVLNTIHALHYSHYLLNCISYIKHVMVTDSNEAFSRNVREQDLLNKCSHLSLDLNNIV
jgi:hypothetical protein